MSTDSIPIWGLFALTVFLVMLAVEAGYFIGRKARRQSQMEKVPPVSSIVGSTLGLLAFMLAFTFGTVASRFDARRALVREEANVIRTAWLRSDFLPESDRGESEALIKTYIERRVAAVEAHDLGVVEKTLAESVRIQRRLWDIAVANGRGEMNSPVAALYVTSLNQMIDLHALRIVIGLEARVPFGLWLALYALIVLGMIGVGYQTVIAESTGRSLAPLMLAFSFAIMIALISGLDRPASGFMAVSQQPLKDARIWMDSVSKAAPAGRTP
jgi:hypothetical protein